MFNQFLRAVLGVIAFLAAIFLFGVYFGGVWELGSIGWHVGRTIVSGAASLL